MPFFPVGLKFVLRHCFSREKKTAKRRQNSSVSLRREFGKNNGHGPLQSQREISTFRATEKKAKHNNSSKEKNTLLKSFLIFIPSTSDIQIIHTCQTKQRLARCCSHVDGFFVEQLSYFFDKTPVRACFKFPK